MKKMLWAAFAAVSTVALVSPVTAARTFSFEAVSQNFTATGTLTTTEQANRVGYAGNTGYRITDISGSVNSNAITGLLSPGSYPVDFTPSNDNILLTSAPYLDLAGFSFTIDSGPSPINIYYDDGYSFVRGVNENRRGEVTSFTVREVTGAVPEPATWAMFIGGFGAIGGMMRRRQRVTVSFA